MRAYQSAQNRQSSPKKAFEELRWEPSRAPSKCRLTLTEGGNRPVTRQARTFGTPHSTVLCGYRKTSPTSERRDPGHSQGEDRRRRTRRKESRGIADPCSQSHTEMGDSGAFHLLQLLFSVELSAELKLRVRFAYDGQSALQFNYSSERFEALTEAALPLVHQFNRDTNRLRKYRRHKDYAVVISDTIVKVARGLTAQPSINISTHRTASSSEPVRLNCLVSGFYPRDINVSWLLNGAALQGPVLTSILLPNVDGTFQLTGHIDVHPRNGDIYTCQVEHSSSPYKLTAVWAPKTNVWPSGGYVIGIMSGIVGIVCTAIGAIIRWRGTWTQTEAEHLCEPEEHHPRPSPSEDATSN